MVNIENGIGKELRAARKAGGFTLREVSAQSRKTLSAAGLSMIEQGHRNPTLRSLEVLARVLGVVIAVTPEGVKVERSK